MKKIQFWVTLFWTLVISIKGLSILRGWESSEDRVTEIGGFAFMLGGSLLCIAFKYLIRRHFAILGAAAAGRVNAENFIALLFQGFVLMIAGGLMVFLKWWAAVAVGVVSGFLVAVLFLRGWPHFKMDSLPNQTGIQPGKRKI